MRTLKQGAQQILVQLCAHASQKKTLNSLIARCSKCLTSFFSKWYQTKPSHVL